MKPDEEIDSSWSIILGCIVILVVIGWGFKSLLEWIN